ncbi:uncharacterized protein LOC124788491 [Schistocerca piceifrons]|uniref:uncharacterized protein LOC124788491 n=1 Tax=Schistocerca piceifrons TaxID=274613 RepID=UPI001F5E3FCF|nr:uncharacterized protein LOC124788491 [Schistocerca piceifrons]
MAGERRKSIVQGPGSQGMRPLTCKHQKERRRVPVLINRYQKAGRRCAPYVIVMAVICDVDPPGLPRDLAALDGLWPEGAAGALPPRRRCSVSAAVAASAVRLRTPGGATHPAQWGRRGSCRHTRWRRLGRAPAGGGGARALRLVRVRVPPLVARGMTARLECRFELQRDRLYSVTWYKDHEEFYRYVPRAPTPQHSYRLEGVRVVDELSDSQQVILRSVSLRATGVYRCEVSAEAPSFTSVHGEGHMQVVSLPHEGPEISGEVGGVFRQGDVLALNCTSGRSSPPARIRWFVNDRQVPPALEASVQQHGLTATVSGLRLVVSERHFSADGRLRVRCQATVTAGGGPDAEPLVETREALVVDTTLYL